MPDDYNEDEYELAFQEAELEEADKIRFETELAYEQYELAYEEISKEAEKQCRAELDAYEQSVRQSRYDDYYERMRLEDDDDDAEDDDAEEDDWQRQREEDEADAEFEEFCDRINRIYLEEDGLL